MEDWNESFLAVEVEREIQKHNAEREKWNLDPEASATATGTNSGCARILIGVILGIVGLVILALFLF
jgi:hypothetical protein